MKSKSNRMEIRPKPNFVGSPNTDAQSSVIERKREWTILADCTIAEDETIKCSHFCTDYWQCKCVCVRGNCHPKCMCFKSNFCNLMPLQEPEHQTEFCPCYQDCLKWHLKCWLSSHAGEFTNVLHVRTVGVLFHIEQTGVPFVFE